MSRANRAILAVLIAAACLASALNARAADAPPPLDKKLRQEIIEGTCAQLESTYVEADTAKMIANALRKKLKSGGYDKYTDRNEFGLAVTKDLRSLNGDLHLSLRPGSTSAGGSGAPVIVRRGGDAGGGHQNGKQSAVCAGHAGSSVRAGERLERVFLSRWDLPAQLRMPSAVRGVTGVYSSFTTRSTLASLPAFMRTK